MAEPTIPSSLGFHFRVLGNAYLPVFTAPDAGAEADFQRLLHDLNPDCPPWQTEYEELYGLAARLDGWARANAISWYARCGLAQPQDGVCADHAGRLLQFVGRLAEAGADIGTIRVFALDHLLWIPAFCERLSEQAQHPFYRELAHETVLRIEFLARLVERECLSPEMFAP